MASEKLGVSADQLIATNGVVSVKSNASRRATYAELVGGRKFSLTLDTNARRKPPKEWTILGTPAKRPDIEEIVTGRFEYVHNVKLPGMLHGRVVRPPTVGATLASVDEASAAGLPGVVKVVVPAAEATSPSSSPIGNRPKV